MFRSLPKQGDAALLELLRWARLRRFSTASPPRPSPSLLQRVARGAGVAAGLVVAWTALRAAHSIYTVRSEVDRLHSLRSRLLDSDLAATLLSAETAAIKAVFGGATGGGGGEEEGAPPAGDVNTGTLLQLVTSEEGRLLEVAVYLRIPSRGDPRRATLTAVAHTVYPPAGVTAHPGGLTSVGPTLRVLAADLAARLSSADKETVDALRTNFPLLAQTLEWMKTFAAPGGEDGGPEFPVLGSRRLVTQIGPVVIETVESAEVGAGRGGAGGRGGGGGGGGRGACVGARRSG